MKVTWDNGTVVEYLYNGDNLLVERKENNMTSRYYYDSEHIVAEGVVQSNGGEYWDTTADNGQG